MTESATIGRKPTLAYALGGLGTGIINSVPTILLLFFATEVLHIPGGTAALIILLPKLWIIFWEPFVGNWSDRTATSWGRRIPFMVVGGVMLVVAFFLLFSPPHLGGWGIVSWVGVAYTLLMSSFSLYFVPYVAVPAELPIGTPGRTVLVSWRMTFAMAGALISATGAPVLVGIGGGGLAGYRVMAAIVAPVCLLAMLMPITMLPRGTQSDGGMAPASVGLLEQLRHVIGNRPFCALAIVQVMQVAAVGSMSAGIPYLIISHLHRSASDVGLVFCAILAPTVFAIPLFARLGRRFGHVWGQVTAAAVFALGAMLVGLLIEVDAPWLLVACVMPVIGLGFGGMQGQSYILSADLIHVSSATGNSGGGFTGVWTACEKLGLALGPAATGVMLGLLGDQLILWQMLGPPLVALASIAGLFFVRKAIAT